MIVEVLETALLVQLPFDRPLGLGPDFVQQFEVLTGVEEIRFWDLHFKQPASTVLVRIYGGGVFHQRLIELNQLTCLQVVSFEKTAYLDVTDFTNTRSPNLTQYDL